MEKNCQQYETPLNARESLCPDSKKFGCKHETLLNLSTTISSLLKQYPRLSIEQEKDLIENNSPSVWREKLILHNIWLAVAYAREFYGSSSLELEDKIMIALAGVVKTAEKYKPEVGYSFGAWAKYDIMMAFRPYYLPANARWVHNRTIAVLDKAIEDSDEESDITFIDFIRNFSDASVATSEPLPYDKIEAQEEQEFTGNDYEKLKKWVLELFEIGFAETQNGRKKNAYGKYVWILGKLLDGYTQSEIASMRGEKSRSNICAALARSIRPAIARALIVNPEMARFCPFTTFVQRCKTLSLEDDEGNIFSGKDILGGLEEDARERRKASLNLPKKSQHKVSNYDKFLHEYGRVVSIKNRNLKITFRNSGFGGFYSMYSWEKFALKQKEEPAPEPT